MSGVAELAGNVCVVLVGCDRVLTFAATSASYDRLDDVVVAGMDDPRDLAVNSATGHLYVVDRS